MQNAQCLPILIGSLPLTDHTRAVQMILENVPEIPLWPQLPKVPGEGMVRQFLSGFPGLEEDGAKFWINSDSPQFHEQMIAFYEDYLQLSEESVLPDQGRFALAEDTAKGFSVFQSIIGRGEHQFVTLKGQVTGPVTVGVGTRDTAGNSIIYNDNLRDILLKHLCLKARWQAEQLGTLTAGAKPVIFIDEPAIVSFGSTGFMGITKELVATSVATVVEAIQQAGGIAGIHICANGDWGPALLSAADIISFDAFFYFDNFVLYREQLIHFLARGGVLAWGIVPTGDPAVLEETDEDQLFNKWQQQVEVISDFGFSPQQIRRQTLIAPSCGTGSLSPALARKVLHLTRAVSAKARQLIM